MSDIYTFCKYLFGVVVILLHIFLIGSVIWLIIALSSSSEDVPGIGIWILAAPVVSIPSLIGMRRVYKSLSKTGYSSDIALPWGAFSALLTPLCDYYFIRIQGPVLRHFSVPPLSGPMLILSVIMFVLFGVVFCPYLLIHIRKKIGMDINQNESA